MNRFGRALVASMVTSVTLAGCEGAAHPTRNVASVTPARQGDPAAAGAPGAASTNERSDARGAATMTPNDGGKVVKSEEEWRNILTPEQFAVMRKQGTEPAFTGKYWDAHGPATYVCAACGQPLFTSEQKFDSGTGWPSYWAPIEGAVETTVDGTHGMERTEVHCSRCGGHLGHVFDDGPKPTGLRYCINSVSIDARTK